LLNPERQERVDMTIRENLEKREHDILSPYAAFSDESKGRDTYEEQCDLRPVYQRDRDRILHSKSFRRVKGEKQGFFAPGGGSAFATVLAFCDTSKVCVIRVR